MKSSLILLAALLQTVAIAPDPHRFQYVRTITISPDQDAPRACAPLDGTLYANASAGLNDVRLYSGRTEVPYAITISDTPAASDPAKVLNLGLRGRAISFDLQMPSRVYSRVDLDLDLHDFIAIAKVTGANRPGETGTQLGSFDLFDFVKDGLGRNTSIALAESSFPYLHFEIALLGKGYEVHGLAPSIVRGAVVPPSRQAQTIYTPVASTGLLKQEYRESVARFHIPARVPVERIRFEIGDGGPRNFSRDVRIRAKADGDARAAQEEVGGTISRINMTEQGQKLHLETLTIPATVGSNAQTRAFIEIGVSNGDDQPVDLRTVRLEMRERKICFDVPGGAASAPVRMFYGDETLPAPQYDYGRLFNTASATRRAVLEAEAPNPAFVPPGDHRSFIERHPHILWAALIAVLAILGLVAFASAKRV